MEAAEKRIEEQAETEEINDQLVAEMEKLVGELETREQALEEAVTVIVRLEDEIDQLKKERGRVQSIEVDYESTYFRPGHDAEFPSSPPAFDDRKTTRSANSVPRMPSFLSEKSEGTEALRSLYLPSRRNYSEGTLAQVGDESTADGMNSPRLSVLSESSFVSIYGEKPMEMEDSPPRPVSPSPPRRHRASRSVEKWIDERPATVAPGRQAPRANNGLQKSQYSSINSMLEQLDSPLQRLEKLKHTLNRHNSNSFRSVSGQSLQPPTFGSRELRNAKEPSRRTLVNQDSFEQQRNLPPTPDTYTSDTLRNFQKLPGDRSALEHPHTREETFLNSTSSFPSDNRYPSSSITRPRSAGETITSKREGHGWDTETQGDFTETASVSSASSMYNGSTTRRPTRVMTPDLFTFGNNDERGWGPEVMYSTAAHIPASSNAAADHYRAARRSSMVEHPRSDDTVLPRTSRMTDLSSSQEGTVSPPDRRSSLSAPTKLRKVQNKVPISNDPPTPTQSRQPTISPAKNSKISQLSGKIFGRSSRSEAPPSPMKPQSIRTPTFSSEGFGDEARATPPPIRRNRTSGPAPTVGIQQRPRSSAGIGANRRPTDFAYDGIAESGEFVAEAGDADNGAKNAGGVGKKWFGIGRAGSLSRRN